MGAESRGRAGARLVRGGLARVPVAVNLSGRQCLHTDIVATVESVVREARLPAGALELELTESMSIDDPPVDKLKIDISFVQDICQSSESLAMVKAIIAMAHSLHLDVIAEGVEGRDQLDLLRAAGCDQVQGFHVSRPLDADACAAWLRQQAAPAQREEAALK